MIFPAEQSYSTLAKVGTYLKSFVVSQEKKLPYYSEAQEKSLSLYLQFVEADLIDLRFKNFDSLATAYWIYDVYLQLRNSETCLQGSHVVYSGNVNSLTEVRIF